MKSSSRRVVGPTELRAGEGQRFFRSLNTQRWWCLRSGKINQQGHSGSCSCRGGAETNSSYFPKILLTFTSIIWFLHARSRGRAQIIRSMMRDATETIIIHNAACSLCRWGLQRYIFNIMEFTTPSCGSHQASTYSCNKKKKGII